MVTYFVSPQVEETIYSMLGRYLLESLGGSDKKLRALFFDNRPFTFSHHFPTHISSFVKNTKHLCDWDEDYVLMNHTLWPYFFSFLNENEVKFYRSVALSGNGMTAGVFSRFHNQWSRMDTMFCPFCMQEAESREGVAYWNRLHQIPNVQICIKHNCFLEKVKINGRKDRGSSSVFEPTQDLCVFDNIRHNNSEHILEVARLQTAMLQGNSKPLDLMKNKFAGLLGYNTRTNILKLNDNFSKHYGPELLKSYNLGPNFISSQIISGQKRSSALVGYILLDIFSRKQLTQVETSAKKKFWDLIFFGKAPWLCINENCSSFNQRVITDSRFRYYEKSERTVGYFICKCGLSYSKSFVVERGKVKDFFLRRFPVRRKKRNAKKKISKEEIKAQRQAFWNLNEKFGSGQAHRNGISQNRAWLRKYDEPWLLAQTAKVRALRLKREKKTRQIKELEMLKHVKDVHQNLVFQKPPFQISKSAILVIVFGRDTIAGYENVSKFLNENCETVQQFRIRRLNQIAEELKRVGGSLNVSNLLRPFHSRVRKLLINDANRLIDKR